MVYTKAQMIREQFLPESVDFFEGTVPDFRSVLILNPPVFLPLHVEKAEVDTNIPKFKIPCKNMKIQAHCSFICSF